jgi:hypothetical protein
MENITIRRAAKQQPPPSTYERASRSGARTHGLTIEDMG